jgi:hypothetical protein
MGGHGRRGRAAGLERLAQAPVGERALVVREVEEGELIGHRRAAGVPLSG